MTPIFALLTLSGLSQREAAAFLGVTLSSVDKMSRGIRGAPDGVIRDLSRLIQTQECMAERALDLIDEAVKSGKLSGPVELGFPSDDQEAQSLGLPTVSAWAAVAARVIAACEWPVQLVPRGSTPATARAADARELIPPSDG